MKPYIAKIIPKYLKYLEFTKSCSPLTLKSYKLDLSQFLGLKMGDQGPKMDKNPPLNPKNPHHLSLFLKKNMAKYLKNDLSPATKNRKTAALKSFFKWLYQNHYIDEDLNRGIKSPKVPVKIPHFLSLDEVLALIGAIQKSQKKEAKRDLSLVLLLYGGGLRVSEACFVRWKDLNFSKHTLKIKGKGAKERFIVLPSLVIEHLLSVKNKDIYVFGKKPLPQRKAYTIVRDWGIKAGLKKNISPHVLRHSYATHILESGCDLRVLQDLLGHESLSATQKYTHIRLTQLSKTLNQFHPLSSKK